MTVNFVVTFKGLLIKDLQTVPYEYLLFTVWMIIGITKASSGTNVFYDHVLLHLNTRNNHVCLIVFAFKSLITKFRFDYLSFISRAFSRPSVTMRHSWQTFFSLTLVEDTRGATRKIKRKCMILLFEMLADLSTESKWFIWHFLVCLVYLLLDVQ